MQKYYCIKIIQDILSKMILKELKRFPDGCDACILACGSMLANAFAASQILKKRGIGITLISLHTIKPIDSQMLQYCSSRFGNIFTLEEHSVIGGLGSAVAEHLAERGYKGCFKRIGLKDSFNDNVGSASFLHAENRMTPEPIAEDIYSHVKAGDMYR